MKNKIIIGLLVTLIGATALSETITWSSNNMFALGYGLENGWKVALYEDTEKDGWDASSILTDGTTDSDDTYLGITLDLFVIAGVVEQWTGTFSAPAGDLALNDNIISVVFNSTDISTATSYRYDTMFTAAGGTTGVGGSYQLPGTDSPASYTVNQLSTWQAVPEPATFLLFGIGGFGAWIARRNKRNAEEKEVA